jgi:hypothetical protein
VGGFTLLVCGGVGWGGGRFTPACASVVLSNGRQAPDAYTFPNVKKSAQCEVVICCVSCVTVTSNAKPSVLDKCGSFSS